MASTAKKKETFTCCQPRAGRVELVGDFTEWQRSPIELKKQKDGVWKTTVPLEPGVHEYRFLVDGQWCNDTDCAQFKPNPFGETNCVRIVE